MFFSGEMIQTEIRLSLDTARVIPVFNQCLRKDQRLRVVLGEPSPLAVVWTRELCVCRAGRIRHNASGSDDRDGHVRPGGSGRLPQLC